MDLRYVERRPTWHRFLTGTPVVVVGLVLVLLVVFVVGGIGSLFSGGGDADEDGGYSEVRCQSLRLIYLDNSRSEAARAEALSTYDFGNCDRFE